MDKVKVMEKDETGEVIDVSWFDRDRAECYDEPTRWDGNNHRGVISGLQIGHECLYRTAGGRWVRYYDARNEFNGPEFHEFISDDAARVWLLRADKDDVVEKYFGPLEDERGPGRPSSVGGEPINIRLGDELLARVDAAKQHGESRAAAIRRLLADALA